MRRRAPKSAEKSEETYIPAITQDDEKEPEAELASDAEKWDGFDGAEAGNAQPAETNPLKAVRNMYTGTVWIVSL